MVGDVPRSLLYNFTSTFSTSLNVVSARRARVQTALSHGARATSREPRRDALGEARDDGERERAERLGGEHGERAAQLGLAPRDDGLDALDELRERVDERDHLVALQVADVLVVGRDEDLERGADAAQPQLALRDKSAS